MPLPEIQNLRSELKRAALHKFAKEKMSAPQWSEYRKIDEAGAANEKAVEDRFQLERPTRIEVEKKRLIDEGGKKALDFNLIGNDRFDKGAIDRQAVRNVEFAHERDLAGVKAETLSKHEKLLEQAGLSKEFKNRGREGFKRAAEKERTRPRSRDQ